MWDDVHALDADRWDSEDLDTIAAEMCEWGVARDQLESSAGSGAGDVLDDVFWVLLKAVPRLRSPTELRWDHRVNWLVVNELMSMPATARLRFSTVGDVVACVLACEHLVPTLEGIFDGLHSDDVAALANTLGTLEDIVTDARDKVRAEEAAFDAVVLADGDLHGNARALSDARSELNAAEEAMRDKEAVLFGTLAESAGWIRAQLEQNVVWQARQLARRDSATTWGLEPGAARRMPPGERIDLARRMNTKLLTAIANLFGKMRDQWNAEEGFTQQRQDEIVDLEHGDDLDRVLPSEMLLLAETATENQFYAQLADRSLLQYEVRSGEPQGRGGMIVCVDASSSMDDGRREVFSKAFMLVLLHLARRQSRPAHVLVFGSRSEIARFDFARPGDFTANRLTRAAEFMWGGGTCFETPMMDALGIVTAEFADAGRVRSDIVFVTDDECSVSPKVMTTFLSELRRTGGHAWGVLVDGLVSPLGALWELTEGRVVTAQDLQSASDTLPILRGTR